MSRGRDERRDGDVFDETVAAVVGVALPVVGPLIAPAVERMSKAVRREHARRASRALAAAEHVAGMTREELADAIADDPRLIPLTTRVLFAAGMSDAEEMLTAMGAALGDAVRDRSYIDEAGLLLSSLADLRPQHVAVLRVLARRPPKQQQHEEDEAWAFDELVAASDLGERVVDLCMAQLVGAGLVNTGNAFFGGVLPRRISPTGRTLLEVLDALAAKGA